ncbi:Fur family transcriptional regulator [Ruminiclostridium josui]|uniref:Fur family transcriptional regulator n=1 Tax=Ruminiclostridium josui TaxID=1499 RepID=UPI0006D2ABFD|nr:transcriptional repressor [Ruminiclostridium josui]
MDKNVLKSSDLKTTKRRMAILAVLENSAIPLTAEEIYSIVIKNVPMSLSTAYRTLGTLSDKGILLKNLSQDGKTYYQINSHQHKHQLVCTLCNETVPIDDCPLSNVEKSLIKQTGFTITGHSLEFSGICLNVLSIINMIS